MVRALVWARAGVHERGVDTKPLVLGGIVMGVEIRHDNG